MFKQLIAITLSTMLVMNAVVCVPLEEQELLDEFGLLADFEHFIAHFGHEAISFLTCMGPSFVTKCRSPVLGCLTTHAILGCIKAIQCEGHDLSVCVHHLREPATTTTKAPTTKAH